MSWLNKSLSQLSDVSASISSFTQDVLAAEPPPIEDDSLEQIEEYRNQIEYYKKEVDRLKNGDSIESKIKLDEIERHLEQERQKSDDYSVQVTNLAEELEESIAENDKLSKRNSFISKQSTTALSCNTRLEQENAELQKSLEEVDAIHQEELQELMRQREEIKANAAKAIGNDNYDQILAQNKQLEADLASLRAQNLSESRSSTPDSSGNSDLKLKMAKLSKNYKFKISDLEKKLKEEVSKNANLLAQIDTQSEASFESLSSNQDLLLTISNLKNNLRLENIQSEKAKSELLTSETSNSSLNLQLKDLTSELEKLNAQIKTSENESSELRNSIVKFQQEIASSETIETVQAKFELESLSANEKHGIELQNLQTEISDLTQKFTLQTDSLTNLEMVLQKQNEKLDVKKSKIDFLESELSNASKMVSSLQSQGSADGEKNSEQIQKLENDKNKRKMEHIVDLDTKNQLIEDLENKVKKLEANLTRRQSLDETVDFEKAKQLETLQSKIIELTVELEKKTSGKIESDVQKSELESVNENLKNQFEQLQSQLENSRNEIEELNSKSESDLAALKKKLEEEQKLRAQTDKNLTALNLEKNVLELELKQSESADTSRSQGVNELKMKNIKLEATSQELTDKNQKFRKNLENFQTELDTVNEKLEEEIKLKIKSQEANEELKALNEQNLKAITSEKNVLELKFKKLESSKSSSSEGLTELKMKNIELEAQNQDLADENEIFQKNLETFKSKMERSEVEFKTLKSKRDSELGELTAEKVELELLNENLKSQVVQLKSEMENSRADANSLLDTIKDQLEEEIKSKNINADNLRAITSEKNDFESKLKELESTNTSSCEGVHELKMKNIELEATTQDLANENKLIQKNLEKFNIELETEKKTFNAKETEYNSIIENLKIQLESQISERNEEIQNLKTKLEIEEKHAPELETHKLALESQMIELKSEIETLKLSNAETKTPENDESELAEIREELSRTLEKLEDAESVAEEASSILEQLKQVELQNHNLTLALTELKSKNEISSKNGQEKFNISSKNFEETIKELREKLRISEGLTSELTESKKTLDGLQKGNVFLQTTIQNLEKENLLLKTQQIDEASGDTSKLYEHINQLRSALHQRETQLQLSLKRTNELSDELKRMHENHQSKMNDHSSHTLLEEQLAHLEAEKEHIHSVMKEKSREAAELSIRLQETGASLHMRTKQLDELATDIQEAKRAKERAEMTQEAMNKLSHLIRAKDCEIEALKTKSDSLMEILRNSEGTDQLTKLLDEADKDRAIIQGVKTEKQDIINAYNQLEHSVMVLKSDFETLEASYQQEIQRMNLAINSQDTQQGITEAHELEIATMKILVEKIRAKSKTGAVREAPDGSDFGGSNHKMSDNSFADKDMLTSSVRNLKERCSALEAKNTAMKRDNDALRDQLMDRREKWDVLEVTNKNLAHEVSNRDAKLSELKAKVTEYTDIIEQQKTIIKTLEKDTKEMARLKEHLMSTEQEFETEMNNRHESEARLQEQVDALRNGLHDASGHHKDLEDKQQENARDQELKQKSLYQELNEAKRREKGFEKTITDLQQFIEHFRQQQGKQKC